MIVFKMKDSKQVKLTIAKSGNNLKTFSQEIGISYSYLSRIITGKNTPSAITAKKIASALNKDVTEIFDVVPDKEVVQ